MKSNYMLYTLQIQMYVLAVRQTMLIILNVLFNGYWILNICWFRGGLLPNYFKYSFSLCVFIIYVTLTATVGLLAII